MLSVQNPNFHPSVTLVRNASDKCELENNVSLRPRVYYGGAQLENLHSLRGRPFIPAVLLYEACYKMLLLAHDKVSVFKLRGWDLMHL